MEYLDWDFFDKFNEFTARDAAYLWCEMEPDSIDTGPPHDSFLASTKVKMISRKIYAKASLKRKPGYRSSYDEEINRQDLLELAEELHIKTKFLHPELREDEKSFHREDEDTLDVRRSQTYLTIIKALLAEVGIDPEVRGAASKVKTLVELSDLQLSEETIRSVLRELENID